MQKEKREAERNAQYILQICTWEIFAHVVLNFGSCLYVVSGLLRASLSTKYGDGQVSRVSAVLQLKRLCTGK